MRWHGILARLMHVYERPHRTPPCHRVMWQMKEIDMNYMVLVQGIRKGEYVMRKPDAKKVYIRGAYDATSKRYALTDCNDTSREIWVKRGTPLVVGFTY